MGGRYGGQALGLLLDYNSPYLADIIGFDASYYAVGNINSRENSMDLLQDDGSHHSFAKLGQAYIKARYQNDGLSLFGQFGRARFESSTINSTDTRVAPDTYFGGRGEISYTGFSTFGLESKLDFNAVRITKSSLRDVEKFESIHSESGQKIDNVTSISATYDMKALKLNYGLGIAKDFNKNQVVDVSLKLPLPNESGFIVNYQHHKLSANGDIWKQDYLQGQSAYKDEATLRNLNFGYVHAPFRVGLSFTKAKAPSGRKTRFGTDVLGYAYEKKKKNVNGNNDPWTYSGNDFNNDGEFTKQLAFEYDIGKTDIQNDFLRGIKFSVIHKVGTFNATDPTPMLVGSAPVERKVKEKQTEYRVFYRFDEKDYAGLSTGLAFTKYKINHDFVPLISAQSNNVLSGQELRLYIDYAF